MWRIAQQEEPGDYVLATGVITSVREFVEWVFEDVDIPLVWEGTGEAERGLCRATGRCLVAIDPRYFRPAEVDLLLGDARKAETVLGWKARVTARQLAREMVAANLALLGNG